MKIQTTSGNTIISHLRNGHINIDNLRLFASSTISVRQLRWCNMHYLQKCNLLIVTLNDDATLFYC